MWKYQQLFRIYDAAGQKERVQDLMKGKDGKVWAQGMNHELLCIAQGNDLGVTATNCVEYIPYADVPCNRKVTYANFVADH